MDGYVMNTTNGWTHAMKRNVGPGAKVSLEELYEQYGVKHDLPDGPEFVEWLRNVKLRNNLKWKIIIEEDLKEKNSENVTIDTSSKPENVAPMVKSKLSIEDVVAMSVRKAREVLPSVTDIKLLKYALQEANQLAGKDSLCNVIRKRIKDLQITR